VSSPGTTLRRALPAHRAQRPKPSSSGEEEAAEEPPHPGRARSGLSQHTFSSFYTTKSEDDTRGRELACPALASRGRRPANDGLLARRVTLVATEGPAATSLTENLQRIQFLDEVVGVLVVLGEEAEGHGCHGVVTPGPVQAAEEVTAFLGKREPAGSGHQW